ncbi:MAG: hypothetical protein CME32_00850 [Gimesia sp.]|nr:hypothetical protein [Gimesia sp.]
MRQKLVGVQALRAIAALAVVLHHVSAQIRMNLGVEVPLSFEGTGARGVELFFGISGFIILYAHFGQIGRASSISSYLVKRIKRILPSTIIISSGWALIILVASGIGLSAPDVSFTTWLSSAFVLPMLDRPEPGVIWTLRNEFVFYFLFSFFLVSFRVGLCVFILWVFLCLALPTSAGLVELDSEILYHTVFSELNLIFVFGVIAFFCFKKFRFRCASWMFIPSLFAFSVLSYQNMLGAQLPSYLFGLVAAILIYSAAHVSWKGRLAGFVEALGDSSFALYLVHVPVMAVLFPAFVALIDSPMLIYVLESLILVIAGLLFYYIVEKPISSALSNRSVLTVRAQPS